MHTALIGFYTVLCLAFVWLSGTAQAVTPERIFAQAAPSVVMVEVLNTQGEIAAQGSGVVTGTGIVITPCHVAQAGEHLRVWHGQTPFTATMGHADSQHDLCQIRAPKLPAPPVTRGSMKTLTVGQPVYVISAPQGLGLTFTAGIVSALRPALGSYLIQTDAAVSPGSSGGGLFDRAGRLVGMPCFQMQEGQQLNFALPVDWIVDVARQPIPKAQHVPAPDIAPPDVEQRTTTLRAKKDWPGLVKLGRQWLQSDPENIMAWRTLGEAYSHLGQHAQALAARRKVVYRQPEDADAWHNLGATYSELGRPRAARSAFQKALQLRTLPPWASVMHSDALPQQTR